MSVEDLTDKQIDDYLRVVAPDSPYERIENALKHLGLSGPLELAEDGLSALDVLYAELSFCVADVLAAQKRAQGKYGTRTDERLHYLTLALCELFEPLPTFNPSAFMLAASQTSRPRRA